MSRRPARCTQADLARAIRAAKQAGAGEVVLRADGSIAIALEPAAGTITKVIDEDRVIPL